MPGSSHDGWDVLEIYEVAGKAVRRAREGKGPTLLEFKVHHIEGNLEGRIEAEEDEKVWCPIHNLKQKLVADGTLTPEIDEKIRKEESAAVEEAIAFALGSPDPEPFEAFDDVFVEGA